MNPTPKILFIATFPPTECGIATYTADLMDAITNKFRKTFNPIRCELLQNGKTFSNKKYSFNPNQKEEYSKIAKRINEDESIHLIHIQHEFGLFGGMYGNYLLDFLENIRKPVVITFHTVLPNPNDELKGVVKKLVSYASSIFVMTKLSKILLESTYQITPSLIETIPHGTHLIKWNDQKILKEKYGFSNRLILSTFGLMGPGKSIETALHALPKIIEYESNVLYLIIGKTHPNEIINSTDGYRKYLEWIVEDLKLYDNVKFINRYVDLPELLELLQATDIYLFTSKDPNQAVSGTFSYAMSCGCPIIATTIPHTKEILNRDLGFLIDIGDSNALANATIELLTDTKLRHHLSINTFQKTRSTAWENVAIRHMGVYHQLVKSPKGVKYEYPDIKLNHLKNMTTARGIIQFAQICIPDHSSGYTLDDNARALIAMCMHYELFPIYDNLKYVEIYLDFIIRCQKEQGTFINYIDEYDQVHIKNDYVNLEDSNARAVWALGSVVSMQNILPDHIVRRARNSFEKCQQWITGVLSPRAIGFIIKGIYQYNQTVQNNNCTKSIQLLAQNLITNYDAHATKDWKWFESYMTYANSVLPEAMLYSYLSTGNDDYKRTALDSLAFLISKTLSEEQFKVISNQGWHHKNEPLYPYGEQPIDVAYTIQTLNIFYHTLKIPEYKPMMEKVFSWFLGNNHLKEIVYNPVTGGCNDGLEKYNVNLNQGAESTVCYLIARCIMEKNTVKKKIKKITQYRVNKLHKKAKILKTNKHLVSTTK
ncbi:glycosyltransferase [Aquimarina sp. 2-A2]|uniref:glycosyltransferase n=1 Tax=Aquimarina sp. 2-A2 TaxID=3382644 RepID=UPI00387F17F7